MSIAEHRILVASRSPALIARIRHQVSGVSEVADLWPVEDADGFAKAVHATAWDVLLIDEYLDQAVVTAILDRLTERVPDLPAVMLVHGRIPGAFLSALSRGMPCFVSSTSIEHLDAALAAALSGRSLRRALYQGSYHDPLTGLPNRRLFEDRLAQMIRHVHRHGSGFSLLYIDLDGFKPVNDTFGHAAGDAVLKEVGQRLRSLVRESDTVARLGGDEFTVLLDGSHGGVVQAVIDKVLDLLHRPFVIDGRSVELGASIGVACFPDDGTDATTLLSRADAAMYRSKHHAPALPSEGLIPASARPAVARRRRGLTALLLLILGAAALLFGDSRRPDATEMAAPPEALIDFAPAAGPDGGSVP